MKKRYENSQLKKPLPMEHHKIQGQVPSFHPPKNLIKDKLISIQSSDESAVETIPRGKIIVAQSITPGSVQRNGSPNSGQILSQSPRVQNKL